MATHDFTADSGNRAAAGIRSFVTKHGGGQLYVAVLDEKKVKAWGDANSITFANDDVYKIFDFKKGDVIIGGFTYVETPGGVAGADSDWGITGGDIDLLGTMDPDAAAGTLVGQTAGPAVLLVDDSLDLVVNTQILFSTGSGRWRLGALVYPSSGVLTYPFETHAFDPNTPPQV